MPFSFLGHLFFFSGNLIARGNERKKDREREGCVREKKERKKERETERQTERDKGREESVDMYYKLG